jgi:hypothetical protein
MEIVLIVMAVLLPIMTINAFIIGYNMNAPKKIRVTPKKKEKHEPTENEKMLERIDNARI